MAVVLTGTSFQGHGQGENWTPNPHLTLLVYGIRQNLFFKPINKKIQHLSSLYIIFTIIFAKTFKIKTNLLFIIFFVFLTRFNQNILCDTYAEGAQKVYLIQTRSYISLRKSTKTNINRMLM